VQHLLGKLGLHRPDAGRRVGRDAKDWFLNEAAQPSLSAGIVATGGAFPTRQKSNKRVANQSRRAVLDERCIDGQEIVFA